VVREITPEELARLLKEGHQKLVLLDVRENDERAAARIDPSLHIRMHEVPVRQREIPAQTKVVVYCHHGHRSLVVGAFLETHGFPDVASLQGGIDAWAQRIDRSIPRY
jgi:rhodanese-related sulfurtransferase